MVHSMEIGQPQTVIVDTLSQYHARPVLVDGKPANFAGELQIKVCDEPSQTVGDTKRVGNVARGYVHGRVVQMTPRALARFQTFPDWYTLSKKKTLACRIIGNAVPSLLYQRFAEYIIAKLSEG